MKNSYSYILKMEVDDLPIVDVQKFIEKLGRNNSVSYEQTRFDDWVDAISFLASDDVRAVKTDEIENLLVALKKNGVLSGPQFARLLTNYLREKPVK